MLTVDEHARYRAPACDDVAMFGGGSSIQIARVFGIRIGASPSWFVVLFVLIYVLSGYFRDRIGGSATEGYLVAVAAVLLFFASIVLHELGHALAARREGITTNAIDLSFFGGIAKLSRDTDSPGAEFKIAAAGPAVTAVVCAVCVGLAAALADGVALDVMLLEDDVAASPAIALLGFLALWNGALLVFNLVPAFPLDGGRLMRAAVWAITGNRNTATRLAGRVGELRLPARRLGHLHRRKRVADRRHLPGDRRLVSRDGRARRDRLDGVHRAHRRHHRRRHHRCRARHDAGVDDRPARAGRVLPALPLGVVPRR